MYSAPGSTIKGPFIKYCPRGKKTTPPPLAFAFASAVDTALVASRPTPGWVALTVNTRWSHCTGEDTFSVERHGVCGSMKVHIGVKALDALLRMAILYMPTATEGGSTKYACQRVGVLPGSKLLPLLAVISIGEESGSAGVNFNTGISGFSRSSASASPTTRTQPPGVANVPLSSQQCHMFTTCNELCCCCEYCYGKV